MWRQPEEACLKADEEVRAEAMLVFMGAAVCFLIGAISGVMAVLMIRHW